MLGESLLKIKPKSPSAWEQKAALGDGDARLDPLSKQKDVKIESLRFILLG
jgi:hypothetical protein